MNKYEMEDLVPIVSKLAEKYTSKESSSISYELARQLMKAVQYCIEECEERKASWKLESDFLQQEIYDQEMNTLLAANGKHIISAIEAYELGYQIVLKKVKQIQSIYNEMVDTFESYGNSNYGDTVLLGLPSFLVYYDAKFQPQNHILTMDYPVLWSCENLCGVDVILKYVEGIRLEQEFLKRLPKEWILEILNQYHANYKNMYFNIAIPVLHHIFGAMIVKKPITESKMTSIEYEMIKFYVLASGKEKIRKDCNKWLRQVLEQYYDNNETLFQYLHYAIDDFVTELIYAVKNECMESLFTQNLDMINHDSTKM